MGRCHMSVRHCFAVLGLALLLVPAASGARTVVQDEAQKKAVYDEKADANKDLAVALAKARKDHQRVLVVFGANW